MLSQSPFRVYRYRSFLPLSIVLLAVAFRFFLLGNQSLWGDEGYTWQAIRGSLSEAVQTISLEGSQAPLYFVLLWGWSKLLGTSEVALRSFSAVAGAVGVWVVYLIGRSLGGARMGLAAGALAALSPLWVYYSQEARPYALAATFGAAAFLFAVRSANADQIHRLWLAAYGITAAAAVLTHYFALFVVLATVAVFPRNRGALAAWLGATAVALIPTLVWILFGWESFRTTGATAAVRGLPVYIYGVGVLNAFGSGLSAVLSVPSLAAVVAASVGMIGVFTRKIGPTIATWLLVAVAGVELLGFPADRPGPWVRYGLPALPAFVLLQAAGIERVWAWRPLAGVALMVGVFAINGVGLARVYFDPLLARFDFRTPVAELAASLTPTDRVVVNKGNPAFFYYYPSGSPESIQIQPTSAAAWPSEVDAELAEATRDAERVFLVKYMPPDFDPDNYLERWLERHGVQRSDEWIEHIRLVSYDLLAPIRLEDPSVQRLDVRVDEGIELLGWAFQPKSVVGQSGGVILFWRAQQPVAKDFKVFVHVVDPADPALDLKVTQHDGAPALGLAPTTRWTPQMVVSDVHPLTVPPGKWMLSIGLYDERTGERPVVRTPGNPDDSRIVVGPISVP